MTSLEQSKKKMNDTIDYLQQELRGIRTGRANPAVLEKVMVEVYGTQMRFVDLATTSAPEPRQLLVSPFDANNVHAIAKAIEAANLNLTPIVDGNVIRINVPEMDASVRKKMVALAKEKCEEAKVRIRNVRRESNDAVEKEKKSGEISEDIMKGLKKKIQELTDSFCEKIDDLLAKKTADITTI